MQTIVQTHNYAHCRVFFFIKPVTASRRDNLSRRDSDPIRPRANRIANAMCFARGISRTSFVYTCKRERERSALCKPYITRSAVPWTKPYIVRGYSIAVTEFIRFRGPRDRDPVVPLTSRITRLSSIRLYHMQIHASEDTRSRKDHYARGFIMLPGYNVTICATTSEDERNFA